MAGRPTAVLLMHGWPYDVRDYDQVVPLLIAKGYRTIARLCRADRKFTGSFERRLLARVGHNPPQEAPAEFARAILELMAATT